MTVIVDAGPLVAVADRRHSLLSAIRETIEAERGAVVLPAYVAAEADYLIATKLGRGAQRAFLRDLASGAYEIQALTQDEHELVVELDSEYPGLGLADLSVVVLAARYRTTRILTLDERHFRKVRPLDGEAFVILPADEVAPAG